MLKSYVYIPDELDRRVKQAAKLEKKSKAEVIRDALAIGLDTVQKRRSGGAEALLKIAELGEKYKVKGPKDSSERIDELLWGKDWNK